jgi:hypothetical protein
MTPKQMDARRRAFTWLCRKGGRTGAGSPARPVRHTECPTRRDPDLQKAVAGQLKARRRSCPDVGLDDTTPSRGAGRSGRASRAVRAARGPTAGRDHARPPRVGSAPRSGRLKARETSTPKFFSAGSARSCSRYRDRHRPASPRSRSSSPPASATNYHRRLRSCGRRLHNEGCRDRERSTST